MSGASARSVTGTSPPSPALGQGSRTPSLSPSPAAAFVLVAAAGMLLSSGVFFLLRSREVAAREAAFQQRAREMSGALDRSLRVPFEAIHALPAYAGATTEIHRAGFDAFAAPALARHPEIAALEWAPVVKHEERAEFERKMRELEGSPRFEVREPGASGAMVRAPDRGSYIPLAFMAPNNESAIGLDLAFEKPRRRMIDDAVAAAAPTVSERFRLVEDPEGSHSVAVLAPVFTSSHVPSGIDARRAGLRGLGVALFRVAPLMKAALGERLPDGTDLAVTDLDAVEDDRRVLYESRAGVASLAGQRTQLVHRQDIPFGNRRYQAAFVGDPSSFPLGWGALAAFAAGLVASVAGAVAVAFRTRVRRLESEVNAARQLGQYTLLGELGRGGMGTVYRARHALLRRPTAVKVVQSGRTSEEALARFEREVRVTSELTHPNTIAIFDYGRGEGGTFYYAMELLEGLDLDVLIALEETLPVGRAMRLVLQAAGSLREAHERGLVHRDVKPANLVVSRRGGIPDFVKVLDFGLAKDRSDAEKTKLTGQNAMVGTPLYMAPEAMTRPDEAGPAVDIYALGAVLYHLVVGKPPFDAADVMVVVSMVLTSEAIPLETASRKPVPAALSELVARCMDKDPAKRPTARELEIELELLVATDQTWGAKQAHAWWDTEGRDALATLEAERERAAKERESGEEHRLAVDVRHRGRR
jgi:CHASE1-domain containing sensor protein